MSDWPDGVTVGPIATWPGTLTPEWKRKTSPFGADLTATLELMRREVNAVTDTAAQRSSVEVLIAVPAEQFRLDGKPRARATATHPGVILSLESRHGRLSYPCDRFTTWQANLRAIVLALESLRRVDRYGVSSHGEQYRGYLAIESRATTSVDDAFAVLDATLGVRVGREFSTDVRDAIRAAKRITHPDVTGDPSSLDRWHRVVEAERVLREAGAL